MNEHKISPEQPNFPEMKEAVCNGFCKGYATLITYCEDRKSLCCFECGKPLQRKRPLDLEATKRVRDGI